MKQVLAHHLSVILIASICALSAAAETDDIVRLPGQGELRHSDDRERINADRLKPSGGLFLSFDANQDGDITELETNSGIMAAFANADANADGVLTALEQQVWARDLPTRDDSLLNPARFDPNLDRRVELEEFHSVIISLFTDYADVSSNVISSSDLRRHNGHSSGRRDNSPSD